MKVVRAEPIAALYSQGKVRHVGAFPALEDQLVTFMTHGYMDNCSPDRAECPHLELEIFPRVLASNRGERQHTLALARKARHLVHRTRPRSQFVTAAEA